MWHCVQVKCNVLQIVIPLLNVHPRNCSEIYDDKLCSSHVCVVQFLFVWQIYQGGALFSYKMCCVGSSFDSRFTKFAFVRITEIHCCQILFSTRILGEEQQLLLSIDVNVVLTKIDAKQEDGAVDTSWNMTNIRTKQNSRWGFDISILV